MKACVSYDVRTRLWTVEATLEIAGQVIPEGFKSDLSSAPRICWRIVAPFDLSLEAPLWHDWVYRHPEIQMTRWEADVGFYRIMLAEGVPGWRRWVGYAFVRVFGLWHWRPRVGE